MACLAFFLSHYRGSPHFKTIDISKLNTEAAQIKLSNPTDSIKNAVRRGLITSAGKDTKQISAVGERYVDALPDRSAAAAGLKATRARSHRKKSTTVRKARTNTK